jgi:hypothetical protein
VSPTVPVRLARPRRARSFLSAHIADSVGGKPARRIIRPRMHADARGCTERNDQPAAYSVARGWVGPLKRHGASACICVYLWLKFLAAPGRYAVSGAKFAPVPPNPTPRAATDFATRAFLSFSAPALSVVLDPLRHPRPGLFPSSAGSTRGSRRARAASGFRSPTQPRMLGSSPGISARKPGRPILRPASGKSEPSDRRFSVEPVCP